MNENGNESGGSDAGNAARNGMGFGGTGSGISGNAGAPGSGGAAALGAGWAANPMGQDHATQQGQSPDGDTSNPAKDGGASITKLALQARESDTPLSSVLNREITPAEADALKQAGLGDMEGVNPNNATQSVNEISNVFSATPALNFVARAFQGAIAAAVPGWAAVPLAAAKTGMDVASGQTLSQSVANNFSGLIGARLGIGGDSVKSAMAGDMSGAVANAVANKATVGVVGSTVAGLSGALGMPSSDVGFIGRASGVTGDIAKSIKEGVNEGVKTAKDAIGNIGGDSIGFASSSKEKSTGSPVEPATAAKAISNNVIASAGGINQTTNALLGRGY